MGYRKKQEISKQREGNIKYYLRNFTIIGLQENGMIPEETYMFKEFVFKSLDDRRK